MTDSTTRTVIARVSHWRSEGCPTELANSKAYRDLDESDDPLHHDIGTVLEELDRRHTAIAGAQKEADRLNNALYTVRGAREQLRGLAARMLDALVAMEHDSVPEYRRELDDIAHDRSEPFHAAAVDAIADRDRARDVAVQLEQQLAETRRLYLELVDDMLTPSAGGDWEKRMYAIGEEPDDD
jgi:hypothetical protein